MESFEKMSAELKQSYKEWADKLAKIELDNRYGTNSFTQDFYANPSYIDIPESWDESHYKIMIVGEELNGSWKKGDSSYNTIEALQKINHDYLFTQLDKNFESAEKYEFNNSPFWKFVRVIYGIDERKISMVWNNFDKVSFNNYRYHRSKETGEIPLETNPMKNIGNGHLYHKEERAPLHSITDEKGYTILAQEISILNPDCVIFIFGEKNRRNLLQKEIPRIIADKLCATDSDCCRIYSDDKPILIHTYHPAYLSQKKFLERVVCKISKTIKADIESRKC